MKFKPVWYFWLFLGMSTVTCTREYVENVQPVCFTNDVLPIFQSNCTQSGCHNSQDRREGYDLSSYASIVSRGIKAGDAKNSELVSVIQRSFAGVMPPSPYNRLTDEQITAIALWVEQGAKNTSCTTTCDTTNVTYTNSVKPIISTYCAGCHGGSSPQGGVDYNNYTGVKATVTSGRLLGSIQQLSGYSAMPKNANKMSTCNINIIKTWINAGALNN